MFARGIKIHPIDHIRRNYSSPQAYYNQHIYDSRHNLFIDLSIHKNLVILVYWYMQAILSIICNILPMLKQNEYLVYLIFYLAYMFIIKDSKFINYFIITCLFYIIPYCVDYSANNIVSIIKFILVR
jgi:hypothetical protein